MTLLRSSSFAGALLAVAAAAQLPEDLVPAVAAPHPQAANAAGPDLMAPMTTTPQSGPADNIFYTPIRGGDDDNGHRYGTWASGPRYKVSFHDGMAFYPVLGARYQDNLPLRWTTTSVRIGEAELLGTREEARMAATDWRQEYRFAQFTESYDVLPSGVEQRFTIPVRPKADGDLVIRGAIATHLRAPASDLAHGALVFSHADGTQIVRYGEAVAIDADGKRRPMQTAFDGTHITLQLDGAWLSTARFPLVVDPLLGNVMVSFDSTNRQASRPDVARDDLANQLMTVYGRLNAGGDYDSFARITGDDFSGTTTVWNDITASWSTRNSDVAFVGGAARWLIVVQRDFPSPTGSWIRYHLHNSGDMVLSTQWSALAGSNGNSLTLPDVGGGITGNNALVVYQSDTGLINSTTSGVFAHIVDAAAGTVGAAINLEVGANLDRETPSVNQVTQGGTTSWICCWTQLDNSIVEDDWDLIIRRLNSAGVSQGRDFLANIAATFHAFQPKIAGRNGRYMVCYGQASNPAGREVNGWASQIWVHRFDWSETSALATKLGNVRVRGASRTASFWNGNIAYDNNTSSHWALVYHSDEWDVFAARVGYDGGLCEAVTVYNTADQGFSPGITFNDDLNQFPLVFAATEGGAQPQPVYGNLLAYPVFAQPSLYGVGCGPAVIGSNSNTHSRKPHCGAEFFVINATGVPNNAGGAFLIGATALAVPIAFLPGCFLNVDPAVNIPVNAIGTTATLPLPIPGGVNGNVYCQYAYIDPGFANPIPVRTTRGLQVQVR